MKYPKPGKVMRTLLIITTCLLLGCSGEDPEPEKGCPQLRSDAEAAYKAYQSNPGDKYLHDIWYKKQALVFESRCP